MSVIERLTEVRKQLELFDPNNRDHLGEISNLKTQEAELMRQADIEEEVARISEERIQTALVETAAAVDSLEIMPGMQLRNMCLDEQSYQFVKIAFQAMLNGKDTKYIEELSSIQAGHKEEMRAAAEREANLIFQMRQKDTQLQQKDVQIQTLTVDNDKLQISLNTVIFERDEAFKVRDNAAAEIEGYKMAVEEKQHQIDTLRAENAIGASGAVRMDQSEQLRKAQEEWKATRVKVTKVRWEDPNNRTLKLAELVVNGPTGEDPKYGLVGEIGKAGDTIRFHYFTNGKYLEVSEEETRFLREQAIEQGNTDSAEVVVENNPLVIPVAQTVQDFRAEGVTTAEADVPESAESSVSGGVVSEAPVTWEAIEARLTAFKQEVIKEIMIGEVA